jgi:phospholipase/carboxylesterase
MALPLFTAAPVVLGRQITRKILILLHGLTLSGRQFAPVGQFLLNRLGGDWRIILPTAPVQAVTWTGGQHTTTWFDLPHGRFDRNQDEAGLNQAKDYVHTLIDEALSDGITSRNIVIGGFSQGGALALLSALTYPDTLGGAVCLSGYLPIADQLNGLQRDEKFPLFVAHGSQVVPIEPSLAENAVGVLQNNSFEVAFKTYPIGHTLDETELTDVADWLKTL